MLHSAVDVSSVDDDRLTRKLGRVERYVVEHALENGLQTPRANVFGSLVDRVGDVDDALNRVRVESQIHALGAQQGLGLLQQRVISLGQDSPKVVARKR